VIALAFLTLGATVMHASGENFSPQGAIFSIQLVELYTATLGEWARPVLLVAVVTTMFSTMLTVIDGFPRAIERTFLVLRDGLPAGSAPEAEGSAYWYILAALVGLTTLVFVFFTGTLTAMIDFATIVSFLTAPVLGYLNLRVITSPHVPVEHRPGPALRAFSYLGLILLGGTALAFAVSLVI
jgi:Mn2+/Fe2+ NRAMP family transporter